MTFLGLWIGLMAASAFEWKHHLVRALWAGNVK
jgi:hypothetical protein